MRRQKITKIGTLNEAQLPIDFEFNGISQDELTECELTSIRKDHGMQCFSTELMIGGWTLAELKNVYYWSQGFKGYNGVVFADLDYLQDSDV